MTIAVDFVYDPPIPGAFDGLRTLMNQHAVFIHTTRDPIPVANWIQAHSGIPCAADGVDARPGVFWNDQDVLLVTNRKLAAVAYIDDRGIRFTDWPTALATLREVL